MELPLNQALMRLAAVTRRITTPRSPWRRCASLLVAIILAGAAPFARFYGDDRLFALVCVLVIGAAACGLTSPCLAEYQKAMSFWRDFVIQLAGKILGFSGRRVRPSPPTATGRSPPAR